MAITKAEALETLEDTYELLSEEDELSPDFELLRIRLAELLGYDLGDDNEVHEVFVNDPELLDNEPDAESEEDEEEEE